MSLIQNSRSLTKSCLPFFSKPRNTGNTSDKRNTPNYVIHVIHLIQVFTSSTSLHIIQVMQVMLVMKVMQASLAHLWVDFRVIFLHFFHRLSQRVHSFNLRSVVP